MYTQQITNSLRSLSGAEQVTRPQRVNSMPSQRRGSRCGLGEPTVGEGHLGCLPLQSFLDIPG